MGYLLVPNTVSEFIANEDFFILVLGDQDIRVREFYFPSFKSSTLFAKSGPLRQDFTGTPGDDVIDGTPDADNIDGLAGNDTLNGLGGNDTINGGDGDDILTGGDGDDTVNAGDGNDRVYLDNGQDTLDGGAGNDTLDGNGIEFADNLEFNIGSGITGNAGETWTGFENYFNGTSVSGGENVNGTAGDNIITTGGGNNTINGGDGNDTISGGGGDDELTGGNGDDVLIGGDGNDRIFLDNGLDTLDGGAGVDTLDGAEINFSSFRTFDLATGIVGVPGETWSGFENYFNGNSVSGGENVIGTAGNNSIITGGGNNTLDGGAGNDVLNAGGGSDTIIGGDGDDTMIGEAGNDTFLFADAGVYNDDLVSGGTGTDRILITVSSGVVDFSDQSMEFLSLEQLVFDHATPGGIAHVILAADEVNATIEVPTDFLIISDIGETDIVEINIGTVSGINVSTWTFQNWNTAQDQFIMTGRSSAETITGTIQNDTINGLAGNDTLNGFSGDDNIDGGLGNDTLTGGLGDDILRGNDGDDTVNAGDGNDRVFLDNGLDTLNGGNGIDTLDGDGINFSDSSNFNLASGIVGVMGETWSGFENYFNGNSVSGGENVFGTSANNIIVTGGSRNTLSGQQGNDTLDSGAGDDVIFAGAGDDILIGGAGNDELLGELGYDTASYANASAGVTAEIGIGATDDGDGGVDNFYGIEALFGSAFNDSLTGDSSDNSIAGAAGDDVIDGRAGADFMSGGLGNDTYLVDVLGDVTFEAADEGTDTVYAAATAYTLSEHIEIGASLLTSETVSLSGNAQDNVLILSSEAGGNLAAGGGGNDTIYVQSNTVVNGNTGNDTLVLLGFGNFAAGDAGDDVYIDQGSGNTIVESADAGIDTVYSYAADLTLSDNIEIAVLLNAGPSANATGNVLDNTIIGSTNSNTIAGLDGNDFLIAGAGDDFIVGGNGADVMQGNSGADSFFYNSAAEGGDFIQDWVAADDSFVFGATSFGFLAGGSLVEGLTLISGINPLAVLAQATFLWDEDDTNLYYDADGTGAGEAVLIADLQVFTDVSVADFVFV